jgi:hypothetical protein
MTSGAGARFRLLSVSNNRNDNAQTAPSQGNAFLMAIKLDILRCRSAEGRNAGRSGGREKAILARVGAQSRMSMSHKTDKRDELGMSPAQGEWVDPSAMDRRLCRRLMAQE